MLLSYERIRQLVIEDKIISPVTEENINSASVELTLGNIFYIENYKPWIIKDDTLASDLFTDMTKKQYLDMQLIELKPGEKLVLRPGQTCLAQTREEFNLPNNIVAEYVLKSSQARNFLGHELAGYCLTGNTKIPLLDGTEVKIEELVGREDVWLYSLDTSGEVVPGKAESIHKVKDVYETVFITLDDSSEFECTLDHKIMTRSGEFIEAQYLSVGDNLMPFNKQLTSVKVMCKQIIKHDRPKPVYDLTVPEHHNFAIASGIFVHNCDPGWHGSVLTMEFTNDSQFGNLVLTPGMKAGQCKLYEVEQVPDHASYATKGRYNKSKTVTQGNGVV